MHWRPKADLTKAWRGAAARHAKWSKAPKDLDHAHIMVEVVKATKQAYDAHNLMPTAKAVIDGLVDYGLIPDDTNAHLAGPDLRPGGKGEPALIITITTKGAA
jgi:hypothetical protein